MDMEKKTMYIMDPFKDGVCFKGYDQRMAYVPTFHTIARMFSLVMGLSNSK
jgi:extradiol dioxygenase family protein